MKVILSDPINHLKFKNEEIIHNTRIIHTMAMTMGRRGGSRGIQGEPAVSLRF
jgi:hypothetical protein